MRRVVLSSTKAGQDAAGRRVLGGITSTTSAPSDASEGVLLGGSRGFWIEVTVGGTTPQFLVDIWCYSFTSLQWLKTDYTNLVFSETSRTYIDFEGGPCRIFFQVTGATGTTPTLDLWAIEAIDEP